MKKSVAIDSVTLSVDALGNYHVKVGRVEMLAVPIVHVYETWTNVNWTIVTNTGIRVGESWGLPDKESDPVVRFMFDMAASAYRVNNPEKPAEVEVEVVALEEATVNE